MDGAPERFNAQISEVIEARGELLIFAGQLTIHAVGFQGDFECSSLAWVTDKEGQEFLLDISSIYATRIVEEGTPPSTWLPS